MTMMLTNGNYFFTFIFAVESFVKLAAMSPRYFFAVRARLSYRKVFLLFIPDDPPRASEFHRFPCLLSCRAKGPPLTPLSLLVPCAEVRVSHPSIPPCVARSQGPSCPLSPGCWTNRRALLYCAKLRQKKCLRLYLRI